MADNISEMVKSFIWITLFAFLMIGFVVTLANNYNKDTGDLTEKLGASRINSTLNTAKVTADDWKKSFEGQSVFLALGGIVLKGIFQLATSIGNFILIPFDIIQGIMVNVIGIPQIVMNIIYVVIILSFIFGIWKLVKSGASY